VLAAYAGDTGSLVYIAEEQGYFTQNGLEVTIKDYEAGKLACDALLAGEVDICTATESVFVSNSFNNPDLRTFGTIALAQITELVARKDRGISKVKDIKNKKIGVTRKSAGEYFLGSFLTFNSLSFDDVTIVDLAPSEIVDAIVAGEIDAGLTWDPNIYNIKEKLGYNVISWPGQSGQDFYFLLISKENWIKNNPKTTERFLKALLQAEQYLKDNPDKAKEFIRNKFGLAKDYIEYGWLKHNFIIKLPQALILAMEDQARWRIENELTDAKQIPNYLDYIYLEALEAVKPEAVTIIK